MNQQEMHTAAREMLTDPAAAAAFFGSLPTDVIYGIASLCKQAADARTTASLVASVRETLTDIGILDQVTAVVFPAEEADYEDWFTSTEGVVHLSGGRLYDGDGKVRFHVAAELGKLYGRVYPGFAVLLSPAGSFDDNDVRVAAVGDAADLDEQLADIRKKQG